MMKKIGTKNQADSVEPPYSDCAPTPDQRPEEDAGQERAEDDLEAEHRGDGGGAHHQDDEPGADLRRW